jgi:hypothetical protein
MDEAVRRDGGPVHGQGAATTTGGTAGPASVRRRTNREMSDEKVAPTTTGDATSGGMSTPASGTTNDGSSAGASAGNFTER